MLIYRYVFILVYSIKTTEKKGKRKKKVITFFSPMAMPNIFKQYIKVVGKIVQLHSIIAPFYVLHVNYLPKKREFPLLLKGKNSL